MMTSRTSRLLTLVTRANDPTTRGLELLDTLREVEQEARRAQASLVDALRDADQPWSAIGAALGITKQAAQMRFGKQVGEKLEHTEPMF